MVIKTKKASTAKQTEKKGRVKVGKPKLDKAPVEEWPSSFSGTLVLTANLPNSQAKTLRGERQVKITVRGIVWGS